MSKTDEPDTSSEDGSNQPIDFYFDFSSPYAYLISGKIDEMAQLYGRAVNWRPVLLGVIFKTTGAVPLLDQPLKGTYSRRDMERMARLYGVPLAFPEVSPFPSVPAARAIYWIQDQDPKLARKVARVLFDEAWGKGGDIRDAEAVVRIAAEAGVDAAALTAALQDNAVKERLKTEIEAAMAAGVCGSPFFIVDGEPFWGADRLDQVEHWLATGGW